MSPTDNYFFSHRLHRFADLFLRTIALSRGKQTCPPYHSPFKRRTNQSSPLQGELEGVGNMAHPENGVIEYLNVL